MPNNTHAAGLASAVVVASLFLSACNPEKATPEKVASDKTPPAIGQGELCVVSDFGFDTVNAACKPGQKVAFLPATYGNEQLPVMFAAVNCDLRYQVALTKGAVTCIYGPITPKREAPKPSAPAPEAKP